MTRARIALFLILGFTASRPFDARTADTLRVSVATSPAQVAFGEPIRLDVHLENRGGVPIAYRAPLPTYSVLAAGGSRTLTHDAPTELVPCVVSDRCESVRIAPGKSAAFSIDLSPTTDLGIDTPGVHELQVGVRVFLLEAGRALPPERSFTGRAALEITDDIADPLFACAREDARLSVTAKASDEKGSQDELSITLTLTNESGGPLSVPTALGCPNTAEYARLYPPNFQGRVSDLKSVYGPGAPELCSYAKRNDFVTLAAGEHRQIVLSLDSLSFGPVPPGRYDAVVAVRNELAQWADGEGKWHPLETPWVGCIRTPGVALEVRP